MKPIIPRFAYSDSEKETLRANYATKGPACVAKLLGRSRASVCKQARQMGLLYTGPTLGGHTLLTDEIRRRLLAEHNKYTVKQWSAMLGIAPRTIQRWGQKLGVRLSGPVGRTRPAARRFPRPAPQPAPQAKPDYRVGGKVPQGKNRVNHAPAPKPGRRPWEYPMNSPEYRAWMDSHTAGKKPVYGIDSMNRPTVIYVPR